MVKTEIKLENIILAKENLRYTLRYKFKICIECTSNAHSFITYPPWKGMVG